MRGLFSTTSYITISDGYGKLPKPDPRHRSKQFGMETPHIGMAGARANNVLFQRKHDWLFGGEKYVDRTTYLRSQPPEKRKLGFQSSDAHRSDEFTQHFPSEQWRERVSKEVKFESFQREKEMKRKGVVQHLSQRERPQSAPSQFHGPKHLFDIGKEDMGGNTPYCMHDARDTWFSKNRTAFSTKNVGQEKNYGGYQLSSQSYGYGSEHVNWSKPAFARLPIVRDNFFRSTGIFSTGRGPSV